MGRHKKSGVRIKIQNAKRVGNLEKNIIDDLNPDNLRYDKSKIKDYWTLAEIEDDWNDGTQQELEEE